MSEDLLEKVFSMIRLDGKDSAPVTFLTMEDGGDCWEKDDPRTRETLLRYYNRAPQNAFNLPPDEKLTTSLGRPGQIASKIMAGLRDGTIDGWKHYRDWHLYRKNECNLKFNPIGRPNQSYWDDELTQYLGLTSKSYDELCTERRPAILANQYGSRLLSDDHFSIVLASLDRWLHVFKYLNERDGHQINFDHPITRTNDKEQMIYQIFTTNEGRPAFAYLPMFRRGLRNIHITEFCRELRTQAVPAFNRILDYKHA